MGGATEGLSSSFDTCYGTVCMVTTERSFARVVDACALEQEIKFMSHTG